MEVVAESDIANVALAVVLQNRYGMRIITGWNP